MMSSVMDHCGEGQTILSPKDHEKACGHCCSTCIAEEILVIERHFMQKIFELHICRASVLQDAECEEAPRSGLYLEPVNWSSELKRLCSIKSC